ncbi:MAG: hypothetical protein CMH48_09925 [Muricauda sp.]|nr:hypothetical protein [Allomuricauda sp.]MBC31152.1 hypothetical protein [Allomuricauda sp.]
MISAQNAPDSNINLALLSDATITSNVVNGRGTPQEILFNPAIGNYESVTQYNEHGVAYNQNLGLATRGNGLNWQVEWPSSKNINYITFGGTYPNQPQPNTNWTISYYDGSTWITLDQGTGGWINSGIYEWGGESRQPIQATKLLLEIYSDGVHDLISIHLRGRGGISSQVDDSSSTKKACLIQYLPSNGSDTQAPTVPTLSSTGQTETTVDLSWSEATDNVGVVGYKIFKDGILEGTLGNVSTYQVTGLTASTTYSFTATATDAAGNESTSSNAVSVTTDGNSGGSSGNAIWQEANSVASYAGKVQVGGISVPSAYKMAIDGKLIAEEVRVEVSGTWPDYVFEKAYPLLSLKEIQKHIEEKGHLPKMPSAKEVKANGIELGEMNRLLLEKIEELTLYIIQLESEINQLKSKH